MCDTHNPMYDIYRRHRHCAILASVLLNSTDILMNEIFAFNPYIHIFTAHDQATLKSICDKSIPMLHTVLSDLSEYVLELAPHVFELYSNTCEDSNAPIRRRLFVFVDN